MFPFSVHSVVNILFYLTTEYTEEHGMNYVADTWKRLFLQNAPNAGPVIVLLSTPEFDIAPQARARPAEEEKDSSSATDYSGWEIQAIPHPPGS